MVNSSREVKCKYLGSVSEVEPISNRKYTFLENEEVCNLVIALRFDSRNTDIKRNEIIGQWARSDEEYTLYFHVNIKSDDSDRYVAIRDLNIRAKLASKIRKIVQAEKKFINANQELKNSKVIVYFNSSLPYYNSIENWGIINDYLLDKDLSYLNKSRVEIELIKNMLSPIIQVTLENEFGLNDKLEYLDVVELNAKELIDIYELEFNTECKGKIFKGNIVIINGKIDVRNIEEIN